MMEDSAFGHLGLVAMIIFVRYPNMSRCFPDELAHGAGRVRVM